jgi:peptidyl-prolyl cis-trans isomerase D
MMNQMRKGVGGFTAKLLLGLLVLSFVVWGIADGFNMAGSPNTVISAGGTDVSTREYQQAYGQAINRVSTQLQRRPTPEEQAALNIDQQVLSQLTSVALLDEEARRLGLSLSDEGLARRIANEPAFRDSSGNYSANTARLVLQRANLTEEQYAAEERKMSRRIQVMDAVTGGMALPAAFSDAMGTYNGERRTIAAITLPPIPASEIPEPDDAAIQALYDDTSEDYAIPELRSYSYVALVPEQLFDPASITEDEIEAEYTGNIADFTTPERRRVQQIVFPDRAAADAAAAAMAGGQSFADAARAAGRSDADVELGLRTADQIPDTVVRDAAFGLQPNQPSGVVEGLFGPVIVQVTEIQPAEVRSLDAVRDEIRQQLAAVRANARATEAYTAIQDSLGSGATLAEAAEAAGLELTSVQGIDQKGRNADGQEIENLVGGSDLLTALFLAQPGTAAEPVNFATGSYVFFDLTDIQEAQERPLDEVRDRVVADWKTDEGDRLQEERAKAMVERARAGTSLADIAAEAGLSVQTTSGLTRASGPSQIGQPATMAAFEGPQGHVADAPASTDGSWMVLQVTETSLPADPRASVQAGLVDQMNDMADNDLLQGFVARLQRDIPVEYHQQAMDQVRGVLQ